MTTKADQFQAASNDILAATHAAIHERSLELPLDAIGGLFKRLEGRDLRDAVVQTVASLEQECRLKAAMAVSFLRSVGMAEDDPVLASLVERVER